MKCGVPQGSVLGPLLFLLYINDLYTVCNEVKMFLFADDTVLLYSAQTSEALQNVINLSVPKITRWLHSNRLSLSIPKTFYQLYSIHDSEKDLKILMNGSYLQRAQTVKYLGILIDENLKFKSHINKVSGLCSRNIGIICRAKYLLNKKLLLLLYNALILPYLTYCSVVWGCNYDTTLKPIITVQKRAIRLIADVNTREHTSPLFKQLGILKFKDLVHYNTLLIMHDYLFGVLPPPFNDKFHLHNTIRHTRNVQHFQEFSLTTQGTAIPNYRLLNYRRHVLFYNGPVLWNNIVAQCIPNIFDIPLSKSLFKKCLKFIFIDNY